MYINYFSINLEKSLFNKSSKSHEYICMRLSICGCSFVLFTLFMVKKKNKTPKHLLWVHQSPLSRTSVIIPIHSIWKRQQPLKKISTANVVKTNSIGRVIRPANKKMKPSQKSPGSIQSISSILLHSSFRPGNKGSHAMSFPSQGQAGLWWTKKLMLQHSWMPQRCLYSLYYLIFVTNCLQSSSCQCSLDRSFLSRPQWKHIFSDAFFDCPVTITSPCFISSYCLFLIFLVFSIRIHMKAETSSTLYS